MKKWLFSLFFIIGTGFLSTFNVQALTYTGTLSLSGVTFNTWFALTSVSTSITGVTLSCFTRLTAPLAIISRFISLDTYSISTGGNLVFRITQSWINTQTLTSASTINYVCSDSFGNTGSTWPQGATGWVTIFNNNYLTGITLTWSSISSSWSSWTVVNVSVSTWYSWSVESSWTVLPIIYQGNNWEYYLNQDQFFGLFLMIYALICATVVSWFIIKHLFYLILNRWNLWRK